jgi:serine phosphatase RsbU (regulator of sigma subunit)
MTIFELINTSYLQTIAYGLLFYTVVVIIGLITAMAAHKNIELEKERLQQKIRQLEIAYKQQNTNLEIKQDEIVKQLKSINENRSIIETQKKELEDSITYAFRIQQAILPPQYYMDKILPSYFIFYLPKSIVSGDFYFIEQEKDYAVIAAVDCTGHGVPGAMMSVIGYDLLNQAVKINHLTKPSEILTFVDEGVTNFLRQTNDESGVHDGMDISVISIHKQLKIVEFAGAYHEVYFTHKQNIYELKGDKYPIGMNVDGVSDIYNNHGVPVLPGDMIYMFSDGFADQFGGPKGKKFKYQSLKELLLQVSGMEPIEQKRAIAQKFSEWKEANEQVDDVLIIGVKI